MIELKIFGYNITKEKRDINYISPISDALTFNGFSNLNSAMGISAVYRAVEIISDNCALLPIRVSITSEKHKDYIPNHPINIAIKNNLLTQYNLIKLLIQSVLLKGNGFCYIDRAENGDVIDLLYLDGNNVQIHYNKNTNDLFYTCSLFPQSKIEPCNMIHLVKNSNDGVNGISVIKYASRSIDISNNTENSANNFFSNGCNLSGILTVQGQLSKEQREAIKTSWNSAYTNNGSGLAILQGNMDYKPVQVSADDAQLIQSRLYQISDIARFFGISPVLLGDLSNSSYNTLEATQQQFLLQTLMPYITMIEQEFNRKLLKPSESNLSINFDETVLLRTNKKEEAEYYSLLLDKGILCINEVREKMNLSPINGGDKHLIAYTDIKQNTINDNGKETDSK